MVALSGVALCVAATAGCSAPPEPAEETPQVAVSENLAACESFAENTYRLAEPFENDFPTEPWAELREDFDMDALNASGDVKERIAALVSGWPDIADVMIYDGMGDVNELVQAVGRACEADDASVDYTMFNIE